MAKRHGPLITPLKRYGARHGFDDYFTTGKRIQVRKQTETEARTAHTDLRALIEKGRRDLLGIDAAELAQFREWRDRNSSTPEVAAVTRQFLAEKREERDVGRKWMEKLTDYLQLFTGGFGAEMISAVREPQLSEWLRAMEIEPRSRNNIRAAVVQLYRWARFRKILPDETTEAERVRKLKIKKAEEITLWTPEEMATRLASAAFADRPLPLLSGFAGVRAEELLPEYDDKAPLSWDDFDFAEDLIHMSASTSKVNSARDIPILPHLKMWLAAYKHLHGPCIEQGQRTTRVYARIAKASGLKHRKNADRHSYGTYRMVETHDIGLVADEMGTSESRIRTNYSRPKNPSVAAAWRAILPPDAGTIPFPTPTEVTTKSQKNRRKHA